MEFGGLLLVEYIKAYRPEEIYSQIQFFMAKAFGSSKLSNATMLKNVHKLKYNSLRFEYVKLLQETQTFCDQALPEINRALMRLKKTMACKDGVNELFQLLLKTANQIDPTSLCKQCHKLEMDILEFKDMVESDKDYKTDRRKSKIEIGVGITCLVASITLVILMPWALPAEMAIVAGGAFVFGVSFPSLFHIFQGIKNKSIESDMKQLSKLLTLVQAQVGEIKSVLSQSNMTHSNIVIRLNEKEIGGLSEFYQAVHDSISKLRDLSLKPIKDF